jgi:hypothetical protein
MLRKLFSFILLVAGVLIALGALGHTAAVRHVHDALGPFPIDPHMSGMIDVVWYYVSGCMLLFGATIVWSWVRYRRGDAKPLFIVVLIGILELVTGIGGIFHLHGDPFFWVFIGLGAALLISAAVLRTIPAS